MKSQIVGYINFDEAALARDLSVAASFPYNRTYSEYAVGKWEDCVLGNQSGSQHDSFFRHYEGTMSRTELGREVPYLFSLIESTFRPEFLRWVRLFAVRTGMIMPHRDYIHHSGGEARRIHVPLQTDSSSLHSEEETVFHMRRGEIWMLNAAVPHSACSMSGICRIALVLDFAARTSIEDVLRHNYPYLESVHPLLIERPELTEHDLDAILELGKGVTAATFRPLASFLAGIHFSKNVGCVDVYDWLDRIAARSDCAQVKEEAEFMRRHFLGG